MESLALASSSSSFRLPLAAARRRPSPAHYPPLPAAPGAAGRGARKPRLLVSACASRGSRHVLERLSTHGFASMSSTSNEMSTGIGTRPPIPPPSSFIGSPAFWIGVGVALSAAFATVSSMVKKYAMQQALKSMMSQTPMTGQFDNSAFGSGSPFPFPVPPQAPPAAPSNFSSSVRQNGTSPAGAAVDVAASEVEAAGTSEVEDEAEKAKARKKFAFVDISPEELQQKELQSSLQSIDVKSESKEDSEQKIPTNGVAFRPDEGASAQQSGLRNSAPTLSVEAIEKMMEEPEVQKLVYPYLPEEMRNQESFKMMLQNPMYRQQMQDMLNNMGGSSAQWDGRMMEHLKNFDLGSPEIRQQFERVGMTPEQVVAKLMANPEVAIAFQNPKIQTAIMDCSQNPLNIVKYQNDKEIMDVFMKIQEIFPQVSG